MSNKTSRLVSAVVFVTIYGVTLVYAVVGILSLLISPRGKLYLATARAWSRTLLALAGARVRLRQDEDVDWTRPLILMSNHQSHFDIPTLFASVPVDLRFLSKHVLAYIPFFGWSMWLAGFIFINRSNQKRAFTSIAAATAAVQSGRNIVVFPEGTRTKDGKLRPFKKGIFVLAAKAAVQVVPVYVVGTRRVLPRGTWAVDRGHDVEVRVGRPMFPGGESDDERAAFADRVREEMERLAAL